MTMMLIEGDAQLNRTELDFFLKGNTSLDIISRQKPYKWVSDQGWKDMQRVVQVGDEFKNLINDLE